MGAIERGGSHLAVKEGGALGAGVGKEDGAGEGVSLLRGRDLCRCSW